MKKQFILFFSFLVWCSCAEKTPLVVYPEEIEVMEESVMLGKEGLEYLDFEVYPPTAAFIYDVHQPDCQVRLEAAPQGSVTSYTPHYKLERVDPLDKNAGRYRAFVRDLGISQDYDDMVRLRIIFRVTGGEYVSVYSKPFRIIPDKIPYFTTISFLKDSNPTAVYEDLSVDVASGQTTVASPFVSNHLLVASFDSKGAEVFVNGVEQISGETVNDYSKPVIFTVKGKSEYSFSVQVKSSDLPVIFVNTPDGREIPSKWEDWMEGAEITIYDSNWGVSYSGTTEIRGRGNTTWEYPKKPYALKLEDKSEILGMPKHKRWVLLANWMDRTLLRNAVSFRLASMTGMAYTPRGRFVELVLNGKHQGNYYLCEQIKVDENRVDIDELDNDEIDGGYLLELDTYYDEIYKFRSARRDLPYMFKDPDEVTTQQFEFIRDYVNNLEESLYDDERFATGEYLDYIDLDSFVDWWLVIELSGLGEPNHPKSTYMHKDKGGKLVMGPVWDFDWGTYMQKNWFQSNWSLYYDRLFQDEGFKRRVKERWNTFETDFRSIPSYIRSEADRIKVSESMNHEMWPIYQYINMDENMSFEDAVSSMIKAYEEKLDWMDKEFERY